MKPNPRTAAHKAYCLDRLKQESSVAAQYGLDAIKGGLDTAAVRNNVGYSLIKSSRYREALPHLRHGRR